MKQLLITACVLLAPSFSFANEDDKLAAFFDTFLEAYLRENPVAASGWGDHRYDDRLDDLSPAGRGRSLAMLKTTLEKLPKEVDYAKLTRVGQIDFEILRDWIKKQLWEAETQKPFERDPRVWGRYASDTVFTMLTQSTVEKSRNVANAAARVAAIPKLVEAAKQTLSECPAIYLDVAIKQNPGAIAFYEKDIFALTGETATVSSLSEPCKKAVAALKDYQQFMENDLRKRAGGDWRIGKERFAEKLKMELDSSVDADELYKEAVSEADRVTREMAVISRQLWSKLFPGVAVPPDDAVGRRAMIRKVMEKLGDDHGEPDKIVDDARKTVKDIQDFIRAKRILTLPDPDKCDIIEMPEFQRGFSTAYLNPAPPLDPKAKSLYAVSPPPKDWDARRVDSYLREYNRAMLKILTIHEAYPGHYVQLEYANRHPSRIRKMLDSGIFAEGWAVYTEQMMLDQGFGEGDLSLRLHQLKFYLRAVVNTLLDHRMHCLNLSDEDARKLLMDEAFQSEGEAVGKIQRAKLSSCQLSTYFAGRQAFYKLRVNVSRARGDAFDLAKYHEEVLSHGTLPVKYLPELVK